MGQVDGIASGDCVGGQPHQEDHLRRRRMNFDRRGGSMAVPSRTPRGGLARSTPQTVLIARPHSRGTEIRNGALHPFSTYQFTSVNFQLIMKLFNIIVGHFDRRNFFHSAFEAPTDPTHRSHSICESILIFPVQRITLILQRISPRLLKRGRCPFLPCTRSAFRRTHQLSL
jgi:hypothetical protein